MSRTANPYRGTPEESSAYVKAMLAMLGERDPLGVLAEGPAALEALVRPLAARDRAWRAAESSWSVDEVVCHLADAEIVYAYRYRMVAGGDDPETPGFDQDRWARVLGYRSCDAAGALDRFTCLRAGNLELLAALPTEAWTRTGRHERRGRETLRRIVELAAAHDLVHLAQIARTRDDARAAHED